MDVAWYPEVWEPTENIILTIGNFDGLHKGHKTLLSTLVERAREHNAQAVVGTFYPHPQEIITDEEYPVLTPLDEQLTWLRTEGEIDTVLVFPFTPELQQMEPRTFYERVVFPYVTPFHIIVGTDHRFGYHGQGNGHVLNRLGTEYGAAVEELALASAHNRPISSRDIREALYAGDVEHAAMWLGRPYQLQGTVEAGKGWGRTIGFPTANMKLPDRKLLPRRGVYVVRAYAESEPHPYIGVMNVGYNPVVEARSTPAVEVHLLDFENISLKGVTLRVDVLTFIRPEHEAGTIQDLKLWIQKDIVFAREYMDRQ
jgi:riboflavin kinase/FMN adenylyltransferase